IELLRASSRRGRDLRFPPPVLWTLEILGALQAAPELVRRWDAGERRPFMAVAGSWIFAGKAEAATGEGIMAWAHPRALQKTTPTLGPEARCAIEKAVRRALEAWRQQGGSAGWDPQPYLAHLAAVPLHRVSLLLRRLARRGLDVAWVVAVLWETMEY